MLIHNKSDSLAMLYRSTKEKKYLPARLMHGGEIASGYEKITENASSVILKGDYNDGIERLVINGTNADRYPILCRSINLINLPDCHIDAINCIFMNTFPENPPVQLEANTDYTFVFEFSNLINQTPDIPAGYAIGYGKTYYAADLIWFEEFPKNTNQVVCPFHVGALPNEPQYLMLRFIRSHSSQSITVSADFKNIMLLKGKHTPETIPTKFMPYFPPTSIEISEPLYKIGNVCDFIEVNGRKALKHQLIGEDQNGKYVLPSPIITDITDSEAGRALLEINTEHGKDKILSAPNGILCATQYVQTL